MAPGDAVKVQSPEAGSPLRTTLPVASAQVGWVIVPAVGAVGVAGWALMTTFPEEGEVQPATLTTTKVLVAAALVTVKV